MHYFNSTLGRLTIDSHADEVFELFLTDLFKDT